MRKAGVPAAAGRPGPEGPVARLDRAADRDEALGVGVEHARATSPASGSAPATRCAVATASSSTNGSSCAASAAVVSSSLPPWTTTASRRSAIRGATSTSSSSGEEPTSANQNRRLLDEVEREPVAARRLRRAHVTSRPRPRSPGRDRPLEGDARPVPDDRVAAVVEPVVGELHAGLPARAPGGRARRFEARLVRAVTAPARSSGSSYASQRTASGPAGTGCSPTRSMRGVAYFGPWQSHFSSAPPVSSRPSARRSGSCARPGARCRSTARSGRRTRSSRSATSPSSARR